MNASCADYCIIGGEWNTTSLLPLSGSRSLLLAAVKLEVSKPSRSICIDLGRCWWGAPKSSGEDLELHQPRDPRPQISQAQDAGFGEVNGISDGADVSMPTPTERVYPKPKPIGRKVRSSDWGGHGEADWVVCT